MARLALPVVAGDRSAAGRPQSCHHSASAHRGAPGLRNHDQTTQCSSKQARAACDARRIEWRTATPGTGAAALSSSLLHATSNATEAGRIDRLVRDLLDYAAPVRATDEPFDPLAAFREAYELLANQGAGEEAELLDRAPPTLVWCAWTAAASCRFASTCCSMPGMPMPGGGEIASMRSGRARNCW